MTNPLVSRERIEQEVRIALGHTLRIDPPEHIAMDASVVKDLHATSIDFLDINFRLENVFGIQMTTQGFLDQVEEELGEGKAIDREGRVTVPAAELLKMHLGNLQGLEAGMYADETASVVTPAVISDAVERVLATLPGACVHCDAAEWKSEDGAKVACGACEKPAEYPTGDELTKRWIHDVEREQQLFASA